MFFLPLMNKIRLSGLDGILVPLELIAQIKAGPLSFLKHFTIVIIFIIPARNLITTMNLLSVILMHFCTYGTHLVQLRNQLQSHIVILKHDFNFWGSYNSFLNCAVCSPSLHVHTPK